MRKGRARQDDMTGRIDYRLQELGLRLPAVATTAGDYMPWQRTGNLVVISGQLPFGEGGIIRHKGCIGADLSLEEGYAAARLCGLNLIAHLQMACDGDLDRVQQVVRLGGFVACGADFTDQPKVINGASDVMVAVFGEAGRHARAAVGVSALPLGAAVEVEGLFAVI
ncbi:MAG: endoribonuclease L-PSP [Rhodospirillaceae bacterium]|nr:MAG: endoribonuclease L-PSP [Rhodospirillaceae bacterium]